MKLERAARELRAVKVVAVCLQSLKPIFLSVCFQSSLSALSNLGVSRSSRPPAGLNGGRRAWDPGGWGGFMQTGGLAH